MTHLFAHLVHFAYNITSKIDELECVLIFLHKNEPVHTENTNKFCSIYTKAPTKLYYMWKTRKYGCQYHSAQKPAGPAVPFTVHLL